MPSDLPSGGADLPDQAAITGWIKAGEALARRQVAIAAAELGIGETERLDDRTRVALRSRQVATVGALADAVARHAARILTSRGEIAAATRVEQGAAHAAERLMGTGLPANDALVDELLAQARLMLLEEVLPPRAGGADVPSLLVRLSGVQDRAVAGAATALMIAESRRLEDEVAALPAELHHRLVWLIAAALREEARRGASVDSAIGEAAQRALASADEGSRVEALAMRLALAIDARADELEALFEEALADRRLTLVTAVLAHAARIDFEQARALVVDRDPRRLGLAFRALGLSRGAIARLLLVLAEADPARVADALPEQVDAVAAAGTDEAWRSLAPLRLGRDYRAAIRLLEEGAA